MPKLCEKCGSYDPTPELAADARCPSCGVVYAKVAAPRSAGVSAALSPTSQPTSDWPPLKQTDVWLSVAAVCVLFALVLFDDDGFVLLLDGANLAFHEAGHLFFGVLGSTLGLYGGTLGQLVFPIVAAGSFWRRRHAVGATLSGVWLFENFLNIARYMADARAQVLPLVGGGEHDWYHIFSRLHLLSRDTDIAFATQALGWLGMIACTAWLLRRFQIQRAAEPPA